LGLNLLENFSSSCRINFTSRSHSCQRLTGEVAAPSDNATSSCPDVDPAVGGLAGDVAVDLEDCIAISIGIGPLTVVVGEQKSGSSAVGGYVGLGNERGMA